MIRRFGPGLLTILSVLLVAGSFLVSSSPMHSTLLALGGFIFGMASQLLTRHYKISDLESYMTHTHLHVVEPIRILHDINARLAPDANATPPTAP